VDHWTVIPSSCRGPLQLDHVKQVPQIGQLRISKQEDPNSHKAPHDEAHLVSVCRYHHTDTSWATGHRNLERRYLRTLYPEVWGPGNDDA
jgi:hypothetical protein